MKIITKSRSESDINQSLRRVLKDLNKELKSVNGLITKADCDIVAGPFDTAVMVTLIINGDEPRRKEVLGVNEKGISRADSMERAGAKLSELLEKKRGEIADIFTTTIVTIPGRRAYTTMIAAVNDEEVEEPLNAEMRRNRISNIIKMLNNDPSTLNIAKVAETFNVSRTIIYKDLKVLGYTRTQKRINQGKVKTRK